MNLPIAKRKADVFSKLDYAEHRRNDVFAELLAAKREDRDPKFLVHAAADVVATARETFDYLGNDIFEQYIHPNTQNAKLKQSYADGKLNIYFPFYESQLTGAGLFSELATIAPNLYADLLDFVRSAAQNLPIPDTWSFNYGMFKEIKDMVNDKKHDQLLSVVSDDNAEILVDVPGGMNGVFPLRHQKGWNPLKAVVAPGTVMKPVAEYRFAFNDAEVGDVCLFAVKATELVMHRFYDRYFA